MKEMLHAVPILSKLLSVRPDLVRAHAKNRIGSIGQYVTVADLNGRKNYYIMRSDIPKVLHRDLTDEEQKIIGG